MIEYEEEIKQALRVTINALRNDLPITQNALKVVIEVIESTYRTDEKYDNCSVPSMSDYARNAIKHLTQIAESGKMEE